MGAQGLKILCLSSMVLVLLQLPAKAQNNIYNPQSANVAQMEVRLQQMETQIRELTGRVENQIYEINLLKQQIKTLESTPSQASVGASQIAVPEREPVQAAGQQNPLNLDFKPPEITGIKTAVPGGGRLDAAAQYEKAFASLKSEKYEEAEVGFADFLNNHSDHVLAANAKYWLGETHYVRGAYKRSARIFAEGFQEYPDSAKSPDILLKLGMSLAGMGKEKDACVALSQLPVKFPNGNDPILRRAEQEMDKLDCPS